MPLLIHLHIPKTAGRILRSILQRRYGDNKIFKVYPSYEVADRGLIEMVAQFSAKLSAYIIQ